MPWVHLEPNQFACVNDAGDVTTAVIESADFQSNSADSSSLGVAQLRLARPVIVIPAGSPPPVVEQLATAERAARHEATRLRLELNNATAHRDNWRARCEQAEARLQPLIDALARREAMATPALVVSDLPPEIRAQILRQRPAPPLQEVSTQPLYNHRNEIIAQIPQRPEPAPPAAPDYVAYALPAGTVLPTSIVQGDPVTISLPPLDAPLPDRGGVQSTANSPQPDLFSHANGGLLGAGNNIQMLIEANHRQAATRIREEEDRAFMATVSDALPAAVDVPAEPASLRREHLDNVRMAVEAHRNGLVSTDTVARLTTGQSLSALARSLSEHTAVADRETASPSREDLERVMEAAAQQGNIEALDAAMRVAFVQARNEVAAETAASAPPELPGVHETFAPEDLTRWGFRQPATVDSAVETAGPQLNRNNDIFLTPVSGVIEGPSMRLGPDRRLRVRHHAPPVLPNSTCADWVRRQDIALAQLLADVPRPSISDHIVGIATYPSVAHFPPGAIAPTDQLYFARHSRQLFWRDRVNGSYIGLAPIDEALEPEPQSQRLGSPVPTHITGGQVRYGANYTAAVTHVDTPTHVRRAGHVHHANWSTMQTRRVQRALDIRTAPIAEIDRVITYPDRSWFPDLNYAVPNGALARNAPRMLYFDRSVGDLVRHDGTAYVNIATVGSLSEAQTVTDQPPDGGYVTQEHRRNWTLRHTFRAGERGATQEYRDQQNTRIHALLDRTPARDVPAAVTEIVSYSSRVHFPAASLRNILYFSRDTGTLYRHGLLQRYVHIAHEPELPQPVTAPPAVAPPSAPSPGSLRIGSDNVRVINSWGSPSAPAQRGVNLHSPVVYATQDDFPRPGVPGRLYVSRATNEVWMYTPSTGYMPVQGVRSDVIPAPGAAPALPPIGRRLLPLEEPQPAAVSDESATEPDTKT